MEHPTADPTDVARARAVLEGAASVAVLTGAGISTDSGIPDYRGPNGVWTRDPEAEKRSTIDRYAGRPADPADAWQHRLTSQMWRARAQRRATWPSSSCTARARLHTLVTQNVDGLHAAAGIPRERLVEVHGTVHEVECLGCGERAPMERALDRVRAGEDDPACRTCGGILKSATVMFGQSLVADDLVRAERAAVEADVLLAVGTSLERLARWRGWCRWRCGPGTRW